ncbi:MAG: hypothetical protein HQ513_17910 [Rhodospirillales bacterium]|nr:hypothetical protein [Rhodospirillales bacterium]
MIGTSCLYHLAKAGSTERFVPLLMEAGDEDAPYLAAVWSGDERIDLVTSGGYCHRIGKSIALATIRSELCEAGANLEVEIFGKHRPTTVAAEPLYDPANERLRS